MGLALCRAARLENARSQVLINRSSNFHGIITSVVVPSWHVASSVRRSCDTHLLGVHLERGGCHFLRACVHVLT